MAISSLVTPNRSATSTTASKPSGLRSTKEADSGIHGWVPATPGQSLFLMPGQWHFGSRVASLRTLLGSCVAITLWHPERHWGGMCHFLLPQRREPQPGHMDGRYGEEAIELLVQSLKRARTQPSEYIAHLYGGADTMPDQTGVKLNVGERNIEMGWTLIDKYGFQLDGVDVGDHVPRTVTLKLETGEVQVKRGSRHS